MYENVPLVVAQESLSCGLMVAKILGKKSIRDSISEVATVYLRAISISCWLLFPLMLSTLAVHQQVTFAAVPS